MAQDYNSQTVVQLKKLLTERKVAGRSKLTNKVAIIAELLRLDQEAKKDTNEEVKPLKEEVKPISSVKGTSSSRKPSSPMKEKDSSPREMSRFQTLRLAMLEELFNSIPLAVISGYLSPFKGEKVIDKDGCYAAIYRGWYPPQMASALCDQLRQEADWRKMPIMMYGKMIDQPRRLAWCGQQGLTHTYSGISLKLDGWNFPEIKDVLDQVSDLIHDDLGFDPELNSCLMNEYKTGKEYIGYHGDKESLGHHAVVATVSLGGSRDFYFKENKTGQVIKTTLHNGDLVIMHGDTQKLYKHSIPSRAKADYRISLTYRRLGR